MSTYTLHHGDCLDILRTLPDASVDAVVTDPPYLTTDLDFDRRGLDMTWVTECLRIVKPNGYLAVFAPVLMQAQIAQHWSMRFSGAWIKEKGGMRTHSAKKPMNQWELYCVFAHPMHQVSDLIWNHVENKGNPYRKVQRNYGYQREGKDQLDRADTSAWSQDGYVFENNGVRCQTDVIFASAKSGMPHAERTTHPTQKPEALISVLVQWLTNKDNLVLDPFMGSGTTGAVCVKLERQFIGIEREAEYIEIARARIEHAANQPKQRRLFDE